jgi:hypothetical protein
LGSKGISLLLSFTEAKAKTVHSFYEQFNKEKMMTFQQQSQGQDIRVRLLFDKSVLKQDIPYSDNVCKCWLHIPKEIVTEGKIAHLHVLIMKQFSYLLRNVPIVLTIDDYV